MLQFSVVLTWKHNVLVWKPCVHNCLTNRVMVYGSSTGIVILAATLFPGLLSSVMMKKRLREL